MRWYKLRASGLIYTVVKKEWIDGEYQCLIRFKYNVKPHPDLVKLASLRAHAELIPNDKLKEPDSTPYLGGWWI